MSARWLFAIVGAAAMLAGAALWLANGPRPRTTAPTLGAEAIYAATFRDPAGETQSLSRFRGKVVVLNFWATWCGPCRAEMPAFSRLQAQWAGRNVQFVGVADDDPERVRGFARELSIGYPLLVGGTEVDDLSQRLGNRDRVVPFTVVLDPAGRVVKQKVGTYSEAELAADLAHIAPAPSAN